MREYELDRRGVRESLVGDYGMTVQQAKIVEAYICRELQSNWEDYLNSWEDIADIFQKVIDAGQ